MFFFGGDGDGGELEGWGVGGREGGRSMRTDILFPINIPTCSVRMGVM